METKEGVALARQPVSLERSLTSLFSLLWEAVTELLMVKKKEPEPGELREGGNSRKSHR